MASTSMDTFRESSRGYARSTGVLGGALDLVLLWLARRRDREILAGLDDRMLRDIGITRADIEHESSKPFWRI